MSVQLQGRCTCGRIQYSLNLNSPDDARTTLCHCVDCKRAFGTNFGLTAKVPVDAFRITTGQPTLHVANNGVRRQFCGVCGSFLVEYGEQAEKTHRYVVVGTLDDPEALPPKGEFFCKERASWMPEISNVFHKHEIKD